MKKKLLLEKNRCYNEKLKMLRQDSDYASIHRQFQDSFPSLVQQESELRHRENKIDESVFFNDRRDKALLIILQKPRNSRLFGFARTVEAVKSGNNWSFTFNTRYIFREDYGELFEKNDFENLALIARYCVLTDGKVEVNGCEIDERRWFPE